MKTFLWGPDSPVDSGPALGTWWRGCFIPSRPGHVGSSDRALHLLRTLSVILQRLLASCVAQGLCLWKGLTLSSLWALPCGGDIQITHACGSRGLCCGGLRALSPHLGGGVCRVSRWEQCADLGAPGWRYSSESLSGEMLRRRQVRSRTRDGQRSELRGILLPVLVHLSASILAFSLPLSSFSFHLSLKQIISSLL